MPYDLDATIKHLQKNAHLTSQGRCAKYVREAIAAGGIKLSTTYHAKDYGSSLISAGFKVANRYSCIDPRKGDVAVIQPVKKEDSGHMAMYDGSIWISDFKQRTMYPGPGYRKAQPSFVIYRMEE